MEIKVVKLTQALKACNFLSCMLSEEIHTHLLWRCQSGNSLCLWKPTFSKHDCFWWLCRELGHSCVVQLSCCDTSLPLQQLPAPLLPLPHCPVLHKGRCLHPSLQARLSPFRVSSTHWGSRKTSTACLACEDWLQRLENRGSWALHAWPISYCHVQPKWPRDFTLRC